LRLDPILPLIPSLQCREGEWDFDKILDLVISVNKIKKWKNSYLLLLKIPPFPAI